MECLTAIGNGVVGKIAEYTVEPLGRQVGYVIYYNRNLKNLQSRVSDLDAARETVEHKIVEEERKGRKVDTLVTNWLKAVNKITGEAKDFLKDENPAKIKCLYGFCPNLMSCHQLSRKSTKLVEEVVELYGRRGNALSFKFLGAIHAGVHLYAREGRSSASIEMQHTRQLPPGKRGEEP